MQEPAFMLIQYTYAVATMLPCPLWFWYRYASSAFLMVVFCLSVYNGATYYIDVFGKRFQTELEAMKLEVQKWHQSTEVTSPLMTPKVDGGVELAATMDGDAGHSRSRSVDKIPLLNDLGGSTGIDGGAKDVAKERRVGDLPA